jgi:nitroreductase
VKASGDQEFLAQAPVVLVFCAHGSRSAARYRERGSSLYAVQDAAIACTYAMLAATALGLATVWVGAFNEDEVHAIIGASPDERPVSMLPIGYAAGPPRNRPRRPLYDIVHDLP